MGDNDIKNIAHLLPNTDDTYDVGSSSLRWDDVYATNGTIQTSDERMKEKIQTIPYGLDFLCKLEPKAFRWKGKARTHFGLIAQDVQRILIEEDITTEDFAPFIHTPATTIVDVDDDGVKTEIAVEDRMGLRYQEFIPILIQSVKEMNDEIAILKNTVNLLIDRVNNND